MTSEGRQLAIGDVAAIGNRETRCRIVRVARLVAVTAPILAFPRRRRLSTRHVPITTP